MLRPPPREMEPGLMREKIPCKYCLKPFDPRGMPAHVHFKHVDYVIRELALNPYVTMFLYGRLPEFSQPQLPAPRGKYVCYAEIWHMLGPVHQMPRWVNSSVNYCSDADEDDAINLLMVHLLENGYASKEKLL